MSFELIKINNFRNIPEAIIEPESERNIFVGENGAGKTSVIEAIYSVARGRSFRSRYRKPVIKEGESSSLIFSTWKNYSGIQSKIGIERKKERTRIRINGQNIARLSILGQLIPLQLLSPQSINIFSNGPTNRRKLMDWGVFHVEPSFYSLWNRYLNTLKQRNAALRSGKKEVANAFAYSLAELAAQIDSIRSDYFNKLNALLLTSIKPQKPLIDVTVNYYRGWSNKKELLDLMQEKLLIDLKRGYTSVGPQFSDLKFTCNSKKLDESLSNGEKKLLIFLFKLAQIDHLNQLRPRETIFLIDDVYSELSPTFQNIVNHSISNLPNQVFLTTPDPAHISSLTEHNKYRLFHVEHGCIL